VKSTDPDFKKTWLLQAAKPPTGKAPNLIVTNDSGGRLFIQTVLPEKPRVKLNSGDELYSYGGNSYPAEDIRGPALECRIEVSPSAPSLVDYFLHLLTAAQASTESVPLASARVGDSEVTVTLANIKLSFTTATVGGRIEIDGQSNPFADRIVEE